MQIAEHRVVCQLLSSNDTGNSITHLEVQGDRESGRVIGAADIANFFMVLEGSNSSSWIGKGRRVHWLRSLMRGSKDFSWWLVRVRY